MSDILQRNFGRLRSLAANLGTERQRRALFRFCTAMHGHAPEVYEEQWGPYLRSLRLPKPFLRVAHEELATLVEVLPLARSTLSLDIEQLALWPTDDTLDAVHEVDWLLGPRFASDLHALLDHPIAARLRTLRLDPSVYEEPENALLALLEVLEERASLPPITTLQLKLEASPSAPAMDALLHLLSPRRLEMHVVRGLSLGPLMPGLLNLPDASRLRSLQLGNTEGTTRSGDLWLDMSEGELFGRNIWWQGERLLLALEEAAWDTPLEELSFQQVYLDADELSVLARLPRCAQLHRLGLNTHLFEPGDLPSFLKTWPGTPELRHLELYTSQEHDVFAELASSPGLSGLDTLYVWNPLLSTDGLAALTQAPHISRLKSLRVRCYVGEDALQDVRDTLHAAPGLAGCEITVERF